MKLRLALSFVVLSALAAPPASAQLLGGQAQRGQSQRPYRGLFGGGTGDTTQSLVANLSLGGVWDDDLTAGGRAPRRDGSASGSLAYSLAREFGRLNLTAAASSTARYYPAISDDLLSNHHASVSATFRFSEKTTLATTQQVSYSPRDVMLFFPGVPGTIPTSDPSFYIDRQEHLTLGSTVNFTQQVTRRGSLYADYSRSQADLTGATGYQAPQSIRGGFSYLVAKGIGVRAGYGTQINRTPAGSSSRWRARTIDFGVDMNRALSLTRRTTLGFGTGVTGVNNFGRTRYLLTGNANLNHEIGRSWTAALSYDRQVEFIDTIVDPLIGDSATLALNGLLSRRLQFNAAVGGRVGHLGTGPAAPDFKSAYATTGLTFGLTRYFALSANYSYFEYRFDDTAVLPIGIQPRTSRQTVQVSVNTWLPLWLRTRRP